MFVVSAQTSAAQTLEAGPSAGELALPDFSSITLGGINGRTLLLFGLLICAAGVAFALTLFSQVRRAPTHKSMEEVSDLIYGTCKTYLITQARFLAGLALLTGVVVAVYFGPLRAMSVVAVVTILAAGVVGMLGSVGVAWFGMRVNTLASSRTAFASLSGKPWTTHALPLRAAMSIGTLLISVELALLLAILLFVPSSLAGACFIGFAIGESLGASVLRIAGGIFTKIADIGADLMKIVLNIKEDDARNPGVIADCAGDNAGDSVGPTADGFESYGVTAVALIGFVLLAVPDTQVQARLLGWVFAIGLVMVAASALCYLANDAVARSNLGEAQSIDFEGNLSRLVRFTSVGSIALTFAASWWLISDLGDGTLWWQLSALVSLGLAAGALIPELVKAFTSTKSNHVQEVVTASREGGASLNVLAGFTAGNFSALWIGAAIVILMALAYWVSTLGLGQLTIGAPVLAFGLLAFGFLGMAPVTIAVDSYGPVTDNSQSVYELSLIESDPTIRADLRRTLGHEPDLQMAKRLLEENDGAGNTFKATAKPVLIGTAAVGATTLIFSTIVLLTDGLTTGLERLSILHPPFLLGLIAGGAVIYWFTGACTQAVVAGAYRAVEFIRRNIRLEGGDRASLQDSQRVVEICTRYAQRGTLNIFLGAFFATLGMACLEPFLFVGYLISVAIFGLFQAIFMANAGGAWDNAKKVVEVELGEKGTALHAATVVGDTVGDPFKDTSSVAMNPIIKFTTLFGLLAVELAVELPAGLRPVLAALFLGLALVFAWRSFYRMRIEASQSVDEPVMALSTEAA
jgi:K(+)-stimulated pyrophosphate-energized sodium pump